MDQPVPGRGEHMCMFGGLRVVAGVGKQETQIRSTQTHDPEHSPQGLETSIGAEGRRQENPGEEHAGKGCRSLPELLTPWP